MRRLKSHALLKSVGNAIGFSAFFFAYFWVMDHPAPFSPLQVIPVFALDHWIVVQQWALIPYASLWFYVCIASGLIETRAEFLDYLYRAGFLCIAGLLTFWLFPTTVPDFGVDWQLYPALAFLKSQDGGANAMPSLHVAFAVFTAAYLNAHLRSCGAPTAVRLFNYAWCALIIYSTLATRQHVFLDALAGMALGALAFSPVQKVSSRLCRINM